MGKNSEKRTEWFRKRANQPGTLLFDSMVIMHDIQRRMKYIMACDPDTLPPARMQKEIHELMNDTQRLFHKFKVVRRSVIQLADIQKGQK